MFIFDDNSIVSLHKPSPSTANSVVFLMSSTSCLVEQKDRGVILCPDGLRKDDRPENLLAFFSRTRRDRTSLGSKNNIVPMEKLVCGLVFSIGGKKDLVLTFNKKALVSSGDERAEPTGPDDPSKDFNTVDGGVLALRVIINFEDIFPKCLLDSGALN